MRELGYSIGEGDIDSQMVEFNFPRYFTPESYTRDNINIGCRAVNWAKPYTPLIDFQNGSSRRLILLTVSLPKLSF